MSETSSNGQEFTKANCTILSHNHEQLDELADHYGSRSVACRVAIDNLHLEKVSDEGTVYDELISEIAALKQDIDEVCEQISEIEKHIGNSGYRGIPLNESGQPETPSREEPPTRVRTEVVYNALSENGPLTAQSLAEKLECDVQAVKQELEDLEKVCMITTINNGGKKEYQIE